MLTKAVDKFHHVVCFSFLSFFLDSHCSRVWEGQSPEGRGSRPLSNWTQASFSHPYSVSKWNWMRQSVGLYPSKGKQSRTGFKIRNKTWWLLKLKKDQASVTAHQVVSPINSCKQMVNWIGGTGIAEGLRVGKGVGGKSWLDQFGNFINRSVQSQCLNWY